jgi:hypothetical protein
MFSLGIRPNRAARIVLSGALALGIGLGGAAVTASSASAAQGTYIATPNGVAGIVQEILISAPKFKGQSVILGLNSGAVSGSLQTTIGANGYGSLAWNPSVAGVWTIVGLGTAASLGSTNITVSALSTGTTILAPNFAQVGQSIPLLAVVSAPAGTVSPQGTVTVTNQNSNVVATGTLTPLVGTSNSSVSMPWTPTGTGNVGLTATFTPSNGNATGSASPQAIVTLSTDVVPVAMRISQSIHVGQPVLLSAVLGFNMPEGSAAFISNLGGISPSIPTVSGVANWVWTPNQVGVQNLRVNYSSSVRNSSGTSLQSVNVLPPLPTDNIAASIGGIGSVNQGSPIVLVAGQSRGLTGATTSGAPVIFSEEGPCVISGSSIVALGVGQCVLTAVSQGTAAYTADTNTYIITVQQAPRKSRG